MLRKETALINDEDTNEFYIEVGVDEIFFWNYTSSVKERA